MEEGVIARTFNVKPRTKDRREGSGDEFSAKQEKLQPGSSC